MNVSKIEKKIAKIFPIKDNKTYPGLLLDVSGCFAFTNSTNAFENLCDLKNKNRREASLEEIQKAVDMAYRLQLWHFYLPEVCYDHEAVGSILAFLPVESITKITIGKDTPLAIESDFGYFIFAPNFSNKSYDEYLVLLKEKNKFFGKKCEECSKDAMIYYTKKGLFYCLEHAPGKNLEHITEHGL